MKSYNLTLTYTGGTGRKVSRIHYHFTEAADLTAAKKVLFDLIELLEREVGITVTGFTIQEQG